MVRKNSSLIWKTECINSKNKSMRKNLKRFRYCWRLFDQNGDGFIDAVELTAVLRKLGIEANDAEIQEMIEVADLNGDGKVDFTEFKLILSKWFSLLIPGECFYPLPI